MFLLFLFKHILSKQYPFYYSLISFTLRSTYYIQSRRLLLVHFKLSCTSLHLSGRADHYLKLAIMAWVILILAGISEIVWVYSMKLSAVFIKLTPSIITLFFMVLSFGVLAYSMRTLSLGTAYTIWTDIGAMT